MNKPDKGTRSPERIGKGQQTSIGRQWNSLCWKKNLYSKQQEDTRVSLTRKSSRCRTSRTIKDAQVNQKELLVARDKRRYQEICSRIYEMLAKQSSAYKES